MERIFGITGGVGMGKSTVGELLTRCGVAVIDTDSIARQIVEPGQPALAQIVQRFGGSILHTDGTLNREELARRIFTDPQARADLEAILHPRIHAIWKTAVERWRAAGTDVRNDLHPRLAKDCAPEMCGAVIIPLLFETSSGPLFDATICVVCSFPTQTKRLSDRGWTAAQIQQRIDAQWPIERKIAQSDYVVWTDTTLEAVAAQVDKILKRNAG
jgi:dephospho-CoA kinase